MQIGRGLGAIVEIDLETDRKNGELFLRQPCIGGLFPRESGFQ
jgi:hypothetical protein